MTEEDRKIQAEGGRAHGKQGGKVINDFLNTQGALRVEDTDKETGIMSSLQIDRLPEHVPPKPGSN